MPRPNRVMAGHMSPWVEYAGELEQQLAELSADYHGERLRADSLFDQLAAMREALETIRDSGLEPIDPAYRRLATDALQEKGE